MKMYPVPSAQLAVPVTEKEADDLAVAILLDRIEDATIRRQMNVQPGRRLTADDLARLGQQGALN